MPDRERAALRELADLYGVQASYMGADETRHEATSGGLLAVLRALGAPVARLADTAEAIRARRAELARRVVEPVIVSWSDGEAKRDADSPDVPLRVPAAASVDISLAMEDGAVRRWHGAAEQLVAARQVERDGGRYVEGRLPLPLNLPNGYHTLRAEVGGETHEALVLRAPGHAFASDWGRAWGVFAPVHALRAGGEGPAPRFGVGHVGDLADLSAWIGGLGGGYVATLPLLAAFLDDPVVPSPYSPVSRLFWNELYVDLERVPALDGCPEARALLADDAVRAASARLEDAERVDIRAAARGKRRVLERLASCFFAAGGRDSHAFRHYLEAHPRAEDYARFRAAGEAHGADWRSWPEPLRDGDIPGGDVAGPDGDAARYHLYAQWAMDRQLQGLAAEAAAHGVGLYLDLPLGVHPSGYDVWRERDLFAEGVSGGAPPDPFFARGQDWGFRPLHPQWSRHAGYRYTIACLRHHMRHAAALRIDHVMGLHRLYWVPAGADARDGVYVRYPADELYAILNLESHRSRTAVVGEDLGTVPHSVRTAMAERGVHRCYVVQFEVRSDPRALSAVPASAAASLDTHDTPTFAAFWQGQDVAERLEAGDLDAGQAEAESARRAELRRAVIGYLARRGVTDPSDPDDAHAALYGLLRYVGDSKAGLVLVALEDLWLELMPQNRPGRDDPGNWRRRMRRELATIMEAEDVVGPLKELDRVRHSGQEKR
jgi:4-alpha-glucanotransferase